MHKNASLIEPDWIISSEASRLKGINEQGVNMACWQRTISGADDLFEHLQRFPVRKLDTFCHYRNAALMLKKHLLYKNKALKMLSTAVDALSEDVQSQADLFFEITGSDTIRLYFTIVDNDMCRKFHTDLSDLRLLCTYCGSGTVCLRNNSMPEDILDLAMSNPDIIAEEDIFQVQAGDVLILKGALHPTSNGGAILHRSPMLSESGTKRILLRLDTNNNLFW